MGWDAYSKQDGVNPRGFDENRNWIILDPDLRAAFAAATEEVLEKAGGVDGMLERGGLDCSDCGQMLERATGQSVYTYTDWSVAKVRRLNKKANWDFEPESGEEWAYWSARKFLEVCAEHGLSVNFSW
jgi:hypothetical protein